MQNTREYLCNADEIVKQRDDLRARVSELEFDLAEISGNNSRIEFLEVVLMGTFH
jgi:hypothetical protein